MSDPVIELIRGMEKKLTDQDAELSSLRERVRVLTEALKETQAWFILDGYDPDGWDGGPDEDSRSEPFSRNRAALESGHE